MVCERRAGAPVKSYVEQFLISIDGVDNSSRNLYSDFVTDLTLPILQTVIYRIARLLGVQVVPP